MVLGLKMQSLSNAGFKPATFRSLAQHAFTTCANPGPTEIVRLISETGGSVMKADGRLRRFDCGYLKGEGMGQSVFFLSTGFTV
jgi:hypothetical protein